MPSSRLSGNDHSPRQAAVARSSGAVPVRRDVHAQIATAMQAQLVSEPTRSARHEPNRQDAATGSRASHVAHDRAWIERPRFARVHASIAERRSDWAWYNSADLAGAPAPRERIEVRPGRTGLSARALWIGGIALALLGAAVLSTVATLQWSRPLPFEAWARGDLMQRAADGQGRVPADGTALTSTPTAADGDRGEVDAALAAHARLEPSDVHIAGLGPILATAAVAERLAADLPLPQEWAHAAGVETRFGRLRPEPPRPVFKPALASSSER